MIMLRYALLAIAAAALLLSSSRTATACTCVEPPPLSECVVADDSAAVLITITCVKSLVCDINEGVAVADVIIEQVFDDKTGLGLRAGDMTTISSGTQESLCGIGESFVPGEQWIMFVRPSTTTAIDDMAARRRLLSIRRRVDRNIRRPGPPSRSTLAVTFGRNDAESDADGVFSDGSICEVMESDVQTDLCSGSIRQPSAFQVQQLADGCENPQNIAANAD